MSASLDGLLFAARQLVASEPDGPWLGGKLKLSRTRGPPHELWEISVGFDVVHVTTSRDLGLEVVALELLAHKVADGKVTVSAASASFADVVAAYRDALVAEKAAESQHDEADAAVLGLLEGPRPDEHDPARANWEAKVHTAVDVRDAKRAIYSAATNELVRRRDELLTAALNATATAATLPGDVLALQRAHVVLDEGRRP